MRNPNNWMSGQKEEKSTSCFLNLAAKAFASLNGSPSSASWKKASRKMTKCTGAERTAMLLT